MKEAERELKMKKIKTGEKELCFDGGEAEKGPTTTLFQFQPL